MKNMKKIHITSIVILLIFTRLNAQEIKWHSIDAGGGFVTGSNDIQVIGAVGQVDVTRMTSGAISLSSGYFPLPVKNESIFRNSFE